MVLMGFGYGNPQLWAPCPLTHLLELSPKVDRFICRRRERNDTSIFDDLRSLQARPLSNCNDLQSSGHPVTPASPVQRGALRPYPPCVPVRVRKTQLKVNKGLCPHSDKVRT
ncbi:hypothetical protein EUGRSUZ_F00578 [Eucalyptus grandis]|uniref:Uncharacterized protein n=2 Tax=Eucalyptus grandis TaxID=71139 RepID=A0ACC3KBS6_EUCGR|nr:hypothetical protein EUGRSUZ_F00578 [Eucalyptus grandis]